MNIALVGYRDWALTIYQNIINNLDNNYFLINSKEAFSEKNIRSFNPDFILFYGWSWLIDDSIINDFKCVMLHPSPLPKYRGGSPIQNQIINGEDRGAVSLFLMDSGIDTGPIIAQEEISLLGELEEIFGRMIDVGSRLTLDFLKNGYQDFNKHLQ